MTGTPLLAVKATAKTHYALRHPSGDGLDAHGFGHWPDDAFTERRRQDGAIRIGHEEEPASAPRKAASEGSRKGGRKDDRAPAPEPREEPDTTDAASRPQAEEH